ncbi:hypothetical protein CMI47_13130 [Candidatus Pacearchaeota archaeon]|nr:hypothetical protein [Candidatus Pacearchaeota archaeon]|tara:strand:- start:69 stop:1175 length:1107 start_codon:yes stop_codon:yes gene_type:complete
MKYPTLYAKASTGKIKQWRIWTEGNLLCTEHGYIDGTLQCPAPKEIRGKNIGKVNETSPEEQAIRQATSKWTRQTEKGYVKSPDLIKEKNEVELFKPMLAKNALKQQHKIVYPCMVQPKLDGVRCLARKKNGKITLWSRAGKLFDTNILKELCEDLLNVLSENQVVDGELFHPEWNFQQITRTYKKRRDEETDEYKRSADLQCWIYDIPCDKPWRTRALVLELTKQTKRVRTVNHAIAESWEDICKYEKRYLKQGYEGLIIRNLEGAYKYDGRSSDLLKLKQFTDEEYIIVGGKEAVGDDAGTVVFTCVTPERLEFNVRPMGTREVRAEYWQNLQNYIGKQLVVKFFEKSEDNIPRFPVGKGIRENNE